MMSRRLEPFQRSASFGEHAPCDKEETVDLITACDLDQSLIERPDNLCLEDLFEHLVLPCTSLNQILESLHEVVIVALALTQRTPLTFIDDNDLHCNLLCCHFYTS